MLVLDVSYNRRVDALGNRLSAVKCSVAMQYRDTVHL